MRPVMTEAQLARQAELNAIECQKGLSAGEWEEWRDLRDNYVLPPRSPEVGTPATYGIGSDRYAGVISRVARNGQEITFMFAHGKAESVFTYRRATGLYRSKGSNCGTLTIGVAVDYRDPSF